MIDTQRLLRWLAAASGLALASSACATGETGIGAPPWATDGNELDPEPADDPPDADPKDPSCTPGAEDSCPCPDGGEGVQVCAADGSALGPCQCDDTADDTADDTEGDVCGDELCGPTEDCRVCDRDCGSCEACTTAPACEGAQNPPPITDNADFLNDAMSAITVGERRDRIATAIEDKSMAARLVAAAMSAPRDDEHALVPVLRTVFEANPAGAGSLRRQLSAAGMSDPRRYSGLNPVGSTADLARREHAGSGGVAQTLVREEAIQAACDNPRLRIRVAKITVHEEDDDIFNDEVYCLLTSEAANGAEVKLTPMTPALDEGDDYQFSLEGGLLWGQHDLTAPGSDIQLHYDCIESDTTDGYANLLDAVIDAAMQAKGIGVPGVEGWSLSTLEAIADLLFMALSLDNDDKLFTAAQVVPQAEMAALTAGAWWFVQREGTNLNSDWDWELRMEIWGCNDDAR